MVRIADGDTLTVLVDRMQVKVRLSEIDAPERGQDFSQRSRQALADLVFGKEVSIETHEKNRYVRVIGDVFVGGKPVNEVMVREGWAWNFVKYSKSPRLSQLEREARAERRGLWGWGLTGCSGGSCSTPQAQQQQQIPSSSYTSPDAGSFLPDGGGVDYTSPDGGSFLPAGQTQAVQQKPMSRYQQAKRQRQDLKTKANQLRQAGRTSGTFVQGELQR